MVHLERTLHFPLAILRQGPVIALQDSEMGENLLALDDQRRWPWELLDDFRREFGLEFTPIFADSDVIMMALNQTFDVAQTSAEQMLEGMEESQALTKELEEMGDLLDAEDDAPVIRLVNTLISQALKDRASDIHIEPFEHHVVVRFRIDGMLHPIVKPPKGVQAALSSRIKVMAHLDIAEKRHPQDGRFRVRIAGRDVDVRVSLLPTAFGERVVMRLLDKGAKLLSLQELGMSDLHLEMMRKVIAAPHGIVLVTGPTGSGKSTTLYAALMQVDRENRNVMTIEDPIEYQLAGVAQMQVRSKIGVNFATGLRAILRQDPDIVMIGEIRDLETAEIAIQASLTGHLVFSTLHTNDALSAIARLEDMGVEPYLLASSLVMVQAQRLVRRLCPHCKETEAVTADVLRALDVPAYLFDGVSHIYAAQGCEQCMMTGYMGRLAIYEMVWVSNTLREAIHEGEGLLKLRSIAQQDDMPTLRHDGARHIAAGLTTVDEVLRVSKQDVDVVDDL